MLYSKLPAFKLGYDLNIALFRITKKFEREYKYTLGEKLKKVSLKLLLNIYRANSNKETKLKYLGKAKTNLETIRLLLRIARDILITSIKQFASVNLLIENLSKQLSSWYKYELKQSNTISPESDT